MRFNAPFFGPYAGEELTIILLWNSFWAYGKWCTWACRLAAIQGPPIGCANHILALECKVKLTTLLVMEGNWKTLGDPNAFHKSLAAARWEDRSLTHQSVASRRGGSLAKEGRTTFH